MINLLSAHIGVFVFAAAPRRFAIAAVFLAIVAWTQPGAGQNEPNQRVVAIGDLHGDYEAFVEVMTRAELLAPDGNWIGGNSILVQLGDIAGRGPDSLKIARGLQRLRQQAAEEGGQVIVLVGNHEAMQMTGDLRYVHDGEWEAFARDDAQVTNQAPKVKAPGAGNRDGFPAGYAGHRKAWAPDGELGAWVSSNPAVVVVDGVMFVHGGVSSVFSGLSVDAINAAVQTSLREQSRDRNAIINSSYGPLWYRGLNQEGDVVEQFPDGESFAISEMIDKILKAYAIDRIVIAHTPHLDGISVKHAGRVIQIDTGMSAYYGGPSSFLEMNGDDIIADNDGERTIIGKR